MKIFSIGIICTLKESFNVIYDMYIENKNVLLPVSEVSNPAVALKVAHRPMSVEVSIKLGQVFAFM